MSLKSNLVFFYMFTHFRDETMEDSTLRAIYDTEQERKREEQRKREFEEQRRRWRESTRFSSRHEYEDVAPSTEILMSDLDKMIVVTTRGGRTIISVALFLESDDPYDYEEHPIAFFEDARIAVNVAYMIGDQFDCSVELLDAEEKQIGGWY